MLGALLYSDLAAIPQRSLQSLDESLGLALYVTIGLRIVLSYDKG